MKTLYISDLDGTLLNNDAVISDYSKAILRQMTDRGINFSVATARTTATVLQMLDGTGVNVPIVLMNGVCVYDTFSDSYVKIEKIGDGEKRKAQDILVAHGLFGFWYSIKDDALSTYYVKPGSAAAEAFMKERERLGKKFTKIERFSDCLGEPLVYFSICDEKQKIEAAAVELKAVEGIRVEFYRDTYIENHWYLEICAETASKRNAVNFLRCQYGFDRVIGFGDNLNDLPMFEACDVSCAVSNAVPEVKAAATHVIGGNNDDGVVKWMKSDIGF